MKERFNSFSELAAHKKEGTDYTITIQMRSDSRVAIVAPHGGSIEWNTAAIAGRIAANDHNLYVFEGAAQDNAFYELHVTSAHFDDPRCLDLLAKTDVTLTIHGCRGEEPVIYLGGNDTSLKNSLAAEFNKHGIKAVTEGHPYAGASPDNICNRNRQGQGVQLEFSRGLRDNPQLVDKCVEIISAQLKP